MNMLNEIAQALAAGMVARGGDGGGVGVGHGQADSINRIVHAIDRMHGSLHGFMTKFP